MEKKLLAILVLVMIAALSIAGCTVTTSNNNSSQNQIQFPPSGQGTSDVSKAITDNYASNGYEIVKPFVKATNQNKRKQAHCPQKSSFLARGSSSSFCHFFHSRNTLT